MNLLIHQGALGDWVLTFPILRALSGPTMAISTFSKAMLAASLFDHVRAMDIEARGFTHLHIKGELAALDLEVQHVLAAADLSISFTSHDSDTWAQNMRRLAPQAKHVFVQPGPPPGWKHHVCLWHDYQLREQGVCISPLPVERVVYPNDYVLIHPGSGSPVKCWPHDRHEMLITAMRASGRLVRVLIGEVERETWPAPRLEHWQKRFDAEYLTTLDALRNALDNASLFVGHDSGPTHLAAQMGVPTVALFGPTSPQCWRPLGPAVTVLAPPKPAPMTWLTPEMVLAACGNKK